MDVLAVFLCRNLLLNTVELLSVEATWTLSCRKSRYSTGISLDREKPWFT